MPFKQSLDLLRFIEKNRKKIKAKERDKAIEEGILKQEAKEANIGTEKGENPSTR